MADKETPFDLKQLTFFKKALPELTQAEFETSMLFSLGLPRKEISWMRNVSYPFVTETLHKTKNKMKFHSIDRIIPFFQVRLVCFVSQNYVIVHSKKA